MDELDKAWSKMDDEDNRAGERPANKQLQELFDKIHGGEE